MPSWRLTANGPGPDGGFVVTAETETEARCIFAAHILRPYGDAHGGYVGFLSLKEEESA